MTTSKQEFANLVQKWADGATLEYSMNNREWYPSGSVPSYFEDQYYRVEQRKETFYGEVTYDSMCYDMRVGDLSKSKWPNSNIKVTVINGEVTNMEFIK